jgi:type II secretory pathway predicted ATPase ExeA
MYASYYGLTERPFTLFPDPDFLYLSPQHKLARAYLEYGLTQRLGFVVLTGEIGTGKTTLIKSLVKARQGRQRIGVLYQTSVGAEDLLELLLREFDIRGQFHSRAARLSAFNHFLLKTFSRGEHVVLIVDEAQNLGPAALEELRLLSNLQSDKEPLLQVILVGQPSLRERLRHPSLRQLAQRVGVHYHLRPLDRAETKEYIQYRLGRVGGSGIFSNGALEKIFDYTQGVPRRINAWCELALVAGFAEGRRDIDEQFLETVVSAQGEALEGPEAPGAPVPAEFPSDPGEPGDAGSLGVSAAGAGTPDTPFAVPGAGGGDNHLHREVMELSQRLARLEGLVLEMTGELLPLLKDLAGQKGLADAGDTLTGAGLSPTAPQEGLLEKQNSSADIPPSAPRRWWSRRRR